VQAEDNLNKDSNNNSTIEEEDNDLKDLESLHTLPNYAYSIFNFCVCLDSDSPHWSILNWPFVEVSEDI